MRTRSASTGTARHAARRNLRQKVGRRQAARLYAEDDDVGVHFGRVEGDARNLCQFAREYLRIVVIDLETFRTIFERNQPRSREHSCLAHTAAEHFPDRPASLDEIAAADDHRSHWRAEPFAQAELHRIEFSRHRRDVLVQIRRRVEHPGAVKMHMNALLVRAVADVLDDARAVNGAAGHVDGVLEADEGRLGTVVHLRSDRGRDRAPRQHAIFAVDHTREHAGERRQRAHLVVVDVAVGLADDFLPGPRLRHDARQVPHRT